LQNDQLLHDVERRILFKHLNLEHSRSQLPPQNEVLTLSDPALVHDIPTLGDCTLVDVFNRIHQTIDVFPKNLAQEKEQRERENVNSFQKYLRVAGCNASLEETNQPK